MILNLDFNPYINKKCYVDFISLDKEIKSNFSNYIPGGSIVISNLLNAFGEESILSGFLGGLNGERYHEIIFEKNLAHDFISIKDETKVKLTVRDTENKYITIIDEEPRITRDDTKQFLVLYLDLITKVEVICGSNDTLPMGLTDEIYLQLIKIANKNNKKFIFQARGQVFKKGIEASPYMVVVDKKILEDLTNLSLQNEKDIIQGSNYIFNKGVAFVVICMENGDIIFLGKEKGYKTVGYVDIIKNNDLKKTMAAFALGINRNYDLDMTLRLAYAFNNYKTSDIIDEIDISDIKRIMTETDISSIDYL